MLRKFNDVSKAAQPAKGDIVYIERKKTQWLGNTMQHRVVRDETLYSLSQSYGIRKKSLARLNKLRADEDFNKGDIIRLK
jgi:LysM repeat protein